MKNRQSSLNVLFISSEVDPLVKIGGLGDVAGSLPLALKQLTAIIENPVNLDIRIAIPYYGSLKKQPLEVKKVKEFFLPTIKKPEKVQLYETSLKGIPLYLVDGAPIIPEAPVYGKDFKSDALKFIFFSLACLNISQELNWPIDILHANDWHTAVAVHMLKLRQKDSPSLRSIHSIISVHNLPFMGTGSEEGLNYFLVPHAKNPRMPKWSRSLPLPMGLNAAERIIAVSPSYAQEIMTPEYGCNLQNFLLSKRSRISGIVNGIDPTVWNPETDSKLSMNYSVSTLDLRSNNKKALQQEFDFPENSDIPLLAFIGRMDRQKGIDLVIDAIKGLKKNSWQLIFLGTGDKQLEEKLIELQLAFPDQIRTALRFDSDLSHRIYSSADILLMPSRYEPCGLAQLIAMRYGCIPVARATGGLNDTIVDYEKQPVNATGLLFSGNDPAIMVKTLEKTIHLFHQNNIWRSIQINAMKTDYSWQNSAVKYLKTYLDLSH